MRINLRKWTFFPLILCSIFGAPSLFADALYFVKDLGGLGGSFSTAAGINSKGQIVGEAGTTNGTSHAFLYENGHMLDLGTLGGSSSSASCINESGQIAGYAYTSSGQYHPFVYNGGPLIDLGAMGGTSGTARSINNQGQVVGYTIIDGRVHGFLYTGQSMNDLNTLAGLSCTGNWINDSAQVVGQSFPTGCSSYGVGFLYTGNTMALVGSCGGSIAEGINNKGQIIINPNGGSGHALIYENGKTTDIGTLGGSTSSASAINENGFVVGWSYAGTTQHAFLYRNGQILDLNNIVAAGSGLTLTSAYAINSKGQIVGEGNTAAGNTHAFLATPYRTLVVERLGSDIGISWFTNGPVSLSLFQSTNTSLATWVAVTNAPVAIGGQYQIVLPSASSGGCFFRLQSQ